MVPAVCSTASTSGDLPDRDLLWYEITYPHVLNVLQGNESVDDALAAMESEANDTFR